MSSQSNSTPPRLVLDEATTDSDETLPKGPLERNNELVRVLSKKRNLENYLENENLEMYVRVGTAETTRNSIPQEDEQLCIMDTLKFHKMENHPCSYVKKVKKDAIIDASREVCTELETQTTKRISYEEKIEKMEQMLGQMQGQMQEQVKEISELKEQVEQIPGLEKQISELQEQVKEFPGLRKRVSTLEKESNISMAKRILRGIDYKCIDPLYIDEARNAFKYNVTLLASGRTDLQPSDFKMFKEFRQCFPYNVNFINSLEEEAEPTIPPSGLSTETQTSQN